MIFLLIISQILTSSFLENRGIRFHTGIDISTNKEIGKPIIAPFEGKIVRIVDKWKGYGRAVYLRNKNNYIYVFVHIDRFKYDIEKEIYFKKKNLKQNEIDLIFDSEVDSGEVLAYSGNSGTLIPHIHFETREGFNKPVNPLYFYKIEDTIKPIIDKIKIYPLYKSILFGGFSPLEFKKPFPDTIFITSDFFLWVSAYDYQSKRDNKLSIYRVKISLFDSVICDLKFDSITFDNNFLARALYTKRNNSYSQSYIHPLNIKNNLWKGSTFISLKKKLTLLKIEAFDFKGNKGEVKLWIKKQKGEKIKRDKKIYFVFDGIVINDTVEKKFLFKPGKYGRINGLIYLFPLPEKSYRISLKNYEIKIPEDFQFFPYPLFFKENEDTLYIFSAEILYKNPLTIKLKKKRKREVILRYNEFKYKYEFFSSDSIFYTYSWGKYVRALDTLTPEIEANKIFYVDSNNIEIRFDVKDNFSVNNIEVYVNEEWEPVFYNPLTKKAIVRILRKLKNKKNIFRIIAKDEVNNFTEFKGEIIIKVNN